MRICSRSRNKYCEAWYGMVMFGRCMESGIPTAVIVTMLHIFMEVEHKVVRIMLWRIKRDTNMEVHAVPYGTRNEENRQHEALQKARRQGVICEYHFE
jgi:hypothetical protein